MSNHIKELREEMTKRAVWHFTAITSDAHDSEYISEHDNSVKFISGFTGTNGRLAVTPDEALLWTDGRYFIQAEQELKGSGIKLMKIGEPQVPSYDEWCKACGFNPPETAVRESIIDAIWPDRPPRPANKIWIHDIRWAGVPAAEKIKAVRAKMKESGEEEIFVNALDDIAWLLNLRGSDIPYNPVFYSFLHIAEKITIYLQPASLTPEVVKYLDDLNIVIADYADFENAADALHGSENADGTSHVERKFSRIIADIKTHKTDSELAHMRECGLRDGVYMTKFIYWLKRRMKEGADIDEIDASDYLYGLRAADQNFVSLSFSTISAYGPNAAIVHYEASEKSRRKLESKGLYLVDSGAQYLDGTTDVTRTIALGPLTDEEKKHYTLVCIGMLRVLYNKFTLPIDSTIIDGYARGPLRSHGLDFNHGTGHGVGFLGCVHEGPARIARSQDPAKAKSGSGEQAKSGGAPAFTFTGNETVSDEPGVYIEGSHGVRIENMVAAGADGFETLTWVPLEREAIDFSLMTAEDKNNFENYQMQVKEKIAPFLTDDERKWLDEI